jgi:hypothetical protein
VLAGCRDDSYTLIGLAIPAELLDAFPLSRFVATHVVSVSALVATRVSEDFLLNRHADLRFFSQESLSLFGAQFLRL